MLLALLIATALADCETDFQGHVAWPDASGVGVDSPISIRGPLDTNDTVNLVRMDADDGPIILQTASRGCGGRSCTQRFTVDGGLAGNAEYEVQLNGETLANFTTSDTPQWTETPEAPDFLMATQYEDADPNYYQYTATWSASNFPQHHFMEFEVRGDGSGLGPAIADTSQIPYGAAACGGVWHAEFTDRLPDAELRARYINPTDVYGPWSSWVGVSPDRLVSPDPNSRDTADSSEPATGCSSLPTSLPWAWALPALLLLRRRQP